MAYKKRRKSKRRSTSKAKYKNHVTFFAIVLLLASLFAIYSFFKSYQVGSAQTNTGSLLSSSFEQPVCGTYQNPTPGCEFGIQGVDVTTGPYGPRSNIWNGRIQRQQATGVHMGIIKEVPLPSGHAFVGVSHKIPTIPSGAISNYIQLEQISPTDGSSVLPGMPVEVRLFPDRRLGLGIFKSRQLAVKTTWTTPVDQWFTLIVEVSNGDAATQTMWVYDVNNQLVDTVSLVGDTRVTWPHSFRTAQKIGGNASTTVPMYTYADDWWIATTNLGSIQICPSGAAYPCE